MTRHPNYEPKSGNGREDAKNTAQDILNKLHDIQGKEKRDSPFDDKIMAFSQAVQKFIDQT